MRYLSRIWSQDYIYILLLDDQGGAKDTQMLKRHGESQ